MPSYIRFSILASLVFCATVLSAEQPTAANSSGAEAAANASPTEFVEGYFSLLQSEGMGAIAGLMHPEELEKFQSILLPVFELLLEEGDRQLIDMSFGPEATIETVRQASGAEFMTAFMNIIEGQLGDAIRFDTIEVLGQVPEGDVIHVVTRVTVGVAEMAVSEMEVISLRPFGESWRMQLTGELEGIAQMMSAQLQAAREAAATEEAAAEEAAPEEAAEESASEEATDNDSES